MRVLLAGASGAIGVPLTRRLIEHGHEVHGLTRDPGRARRLAERGVRPVVTDGGRLPWIHVEDAAAATVAALEHGRAGEAYNVADDEPATMAEVFTEMARAFGAPPPRRLPAWLLRLVAPYAVTFAVDTNLRVSSARAREELGWRPAYPTYRDGMAALARG